MWVQLKYLLEQKIASLGGEVSFHRKPMSGYFATLLACQVSASPTDALHGAPTSPLNHITAEVYECWSINGVIDVMICLYVHMTDL